VWRGPGFVILGIVGAILTFEALKNAWMNIASGRQALAFDSAMSVVAILKGSACTAVIAEELEVALWLNDINSGAD
jgi:hypothetical protein